MSKPRVLLICGTLNQTLMMLKISRELKGCLCRFSPFYVDGPILSYLQKRGVLNFTVLGGNPRQKTLDFMTRHNLPLDEAGQEGDYDLVVTCSDLVLQQNIQDKKIVLVQEGMTDPENYRYRLVRAFGFPRFLANTSVIGLSHGYRYFCVASEGFRQIFVRKGVDPRKIVVTGIPNFDDVESLLDNPFPHEDYVLAATSYLRETFKYENRRAFIRKVRKVADGRPIIFKLHPYERHQRAVAEIERYAPEALIYADGNTDHMIANCSTLVTKYSTVLMVALALEKPIVCDLESSYLKLLRPVQNGGTSAANIAQVCFDLLDQP